MKSELDCTIAMFWIVRKARYLVFPKVKNARCAFSYGQLDRSVARAAARIAISPATSFDILVGAQPAAPIKGH